MKEMQKMKEMKKISKASSTKAEAAEIFHYGSQAFELNRLEVAYSFFITVRVV